MTYLFTCSTSVKMAMLNIEKITSVLRGIEQQVERGNYFPIIGPVKGELLYLVTLLIRPKHVLELGTGLGYSGLQIARALRYGARITTVEEDEAIAEIAIQNFRKAGVERIINVIMEEAGEFIERDQSLYDMIFMDVEKHRYLQLLEGCIAKLRIGGVLVADNVLRSELRSFRQAILKHPKLVSSIIHLEDGVSVSVKKD